MAAAFGSFADPLVRRLGLQMRHVRFHFTNTLCSPASVADMATVWEDILSEVVVNGKAQWKKVQGPIGVLMLMLFEVGIYPSKLQLWKLPGGNLLATGLLGTECQFEKALRSVVHLSLRCVWASASGHAYGDQSSDGVSDHLSFELYRRLVKSRPQFAGIMLAFNLGLHRPS